MQVTLAKSAGFCFGVKRAVDQVYQEAEHSRMPVYTFGPIIHNETVVKDLEEKGVYAIGGIEELKHLPKGIVVIRSHGVSKEIYEKIETEGFRIVDATCPFVLKIHRFAEDYSKKGYHILIIGNASHPEVEGIKGWSDPDGTTVLQSAEEARNFKLPEGENGRPNVCIVSQTTFNYNKFQELVEIIEKKGYDIYVVNTICNATSTRQKEAEELAARSEAMIVIGGKHSSNSRKLYEICKNQCANTFFIQTVDELSSISLSSFTSLGITAGASTPNNIIQEVLRACQI